MASNNATKDLIQSINNMIVETTASDKQRKVVDIITFCEDPKYLNFGGQNPPIKLWPMQKIALKLFYRGTRGNEDLKLNDEEMKILEKIAKEEDLDYDHDSGGFLQVIEKYKRGATFRTFVMVMGRRSSKTFVVSVIAAYEAYKLLETPGGNPQKFYNMPPDKPIAIVNVATSEAQAYDPLFIEIESRIARSPYFEGKISPSSKKGSLYLLTDADRKEMGIRKSKGIDVTIDGSVQLLSGHSNSASIRGKATICILFDEFAHFINSSGRTSGDEVYNALQPSTQQFGKDGKIVLLSDPKGKDGMFWKLFEMSQKLEKKPDGELNWPHDDILALQLPTWTINPTEEFSKTKLTREERPKDPIAFLGTWAAKFAGSAGSRMFDERRLEDCIDLRMTEPEYGDPRNAYFLHLDPATTSHNYALAIVHVITVANKFMQMRKRVIIDKVKFWRPDENGPVDIDEVEKYIRDCAGKFNVAAVTFDSFQSAQTIGRLKSMGINAFETPFSPQYISNIYGELRNMVHEGDIIICPNPQLVGEMKNLLYKYVARGTHRFFDIKSDFPSDDCVDAVAGAAFQALHYHVARSLPRSTVVYMPRTQSSYGRMR